MVLRLDKGVVRFGLPGLLLGLVLAWASGIRGPEVAAQTGFSDQAALTRAFANVVGATPAKWRREQSSRRVPVETPTSQFPKTPE